MLLIEMKEKNAFQSVHSNRMAQGSVAIKPGTEVGDTAGKDGDKSASPH